MKRYYKVMLGPKNCHAETCKNENFIGVDPGIDVDLHNRFTERLRDFNKEFIPLYLKKNPGKTKVAAGLACGTTWTFGTGMKQGDIILCSDGNDQFELAEVVGGYSYHPGQPLPHRRPVKWLSVSIDKEIMQGSLKSAVSSSWYHCELSKYSKELEDLIAGLRPQTIVSNDATIEDPVVFALEKHLEEFLIQNWRYTELGKNYDIYCENGELVGQQYPSDTGPIDILAISKDKKSLLVVELKKGRVSDHVVGQIQRYMGYVKEELAEDNQAVKGVIIGLEDDLRIKRALSVTNNIEFYRYEVSFKLFKP